MVLAVEATGWNNVCIVSCPTWNWDHFYNFHTVFQNDCEHIVHLHPLGYSSWYELVLWVEDSNHIDSEDELCTHLEEYHRPRKQFHFGGADCNILCDRGDLRCMHEY